MNVCRQSNRAIIALVLVVSFAVGCAQRKQRDLRHQATAPVRITVGNFSLLPNVPVVALFELPHDFETDLAPLWSRDGASVYLIRANPREITTLGLNLHGRGKVVGTNTAAVGFTIRQEPDQGILAFAVDPGHEKLTLVTFDRKRNVTDVTVYSLRKPGTGKQIVRLPGVTLESNVAWRSSEDILLGLGPRVIGNSPNPDFSFAGLYRFVLAKRIDASQLYPVCGEELDFSRFVVSPRGRWLLVAAKRANSLFLIDLKDLRCQKAKFLSPSRISVVGWSRDESRILYVESEYPGFVTSAKVWEYDLRKQMRRLIGDPGTAAVYLKDDSIAIIGSRDLKASRIKAASQRLIPAQLGLFSPSRDEITISPLGAWTTAELLLSGSISYSPQNSVLAVEIPIPVKEGFLASLMYFQPTYKRLGLLGSGPKNHTPLLSWSPDGLWLAVCDCTPPKPELLVIAPPLNTELVEAPKK